MQSSRLPYWANFTRPFELIENAKPDVMLAQRSVLRVVLGRQRNGPLLNVSPACRRSQS